ncbi:MAG: DedA family protein [Xanthobacteraceae bacterium]|nr:DedA family protein [Xanthobacteraceae bacterium]
MSTLNGLLAVLSAHPLWSCAAVFAAALLEAVPVLGSFVPGSTLILGIGAAAAFDALPALLVSTIAGALIGDGAAYLLGYRAKREILEAWPLSRYPRVVARSERFFTRHGMLAVFFARFIPPIRAFVPVTAGALGMPPQRFFPVNVAAILAWAPLHVVPGALAGSALRHWGTTEWHHPMVLAALAAVVCIVGWTVWQHLRHALPSLAADIGEPN